MKRTYFYLLTIISLFVCLPYSIHSQTFFSPAIKQTADSVKMKQWVDSVYKTLSQDEQIGQLFTIIATGNNTVANKSLLKKYVDEMHIGGILFSKSTPNNQAELTNYAQSISAVPLMISLDGEWGLSMRLDNTPEFPRNMMLGAIQNDSLLYLYGKEVARQCQLMGIHINFAPDMDVNSNPANPVIGTRSFGENPRRVAKAGIMYAKGLESGRVMAVAKHFPGHGDTSTDSHHALPLITHSKARLDSVELAPFREYIKAGLSGMMIGHLDIPALDSNKGPSSLSYPIVTGLLKDVLGFDGLTFTDGLQMKGVSGEDDYCVRAIQAGNDVLLGPLSPFKDYKDVKKAVEKGQISKAQLEEKCKKILAYKYILGVNDKKSVKTDGLIRELNTPYSDWLIEKLNQNAITLLKNKEQLLPLKKLDERKIAAVAVGAGANNDFHKMLKKYGNVTCYSVSDASELINLKKSLDKFSTIIISVHTTKINVNAAIQSVTAGKDAILTFFINPYRMGGYADAIQSSDGLLLAYENSSFAQEAAAQGVFGGINLSGRIPVSVNGLFREGDGLDSYKTRLGYSMPEEVGIPSSRFARIDSIAKEGIEKKAYPGCQVLIAKNGVIIYDRSFGSYEYDGKQKVTDESVYDIASMTKTIATVPALMKLYDEKKFSLNQPLANYVSVLKGTDKANITIRQALFHETGLVSFLPYYMYAIDKDSYEGRLFSSRKTATHTAMFDATTWARTDYEYKKDLVSKTPKANFNQIADGLYINNSYRDTLLLEIANSKLRKRKDYLYSCLNFMLLKEVAENISKTNLNSFLQDNFYRRLGASSTTYNPLQNGIDSDLIVPTEKDDFLRKQLLKGYVHDEGAAFLGGISGNAGLFSTADDVAKLCQLWLNGGEYGGERYLSDKTCDVFTKTKSSQSRRGLGFDKPETRTNKVNPCSPSTPASTYGHTGFTGTCFWVDPDNDLIYIFLSNRVYPKRTQKALMELNIRPRIQEAIYVAIRGEENDKSIPNVSEILEEENESPSTDK